MSKVELVDKLNSLKAEVESTISKAETEGRPLTAEEEEKLTSLKAEIDGVEAQIAELEKELKSRFRKPAPQVSNRSAGVERRSFSLMRAISDVANGSAAGGRGNGSGERGDRGNASFGAVLEWSDCFACVGKPGDDPGDDSRRRDGERADGCVGNHGGAPQTTGAGAGRSVVYDGTDGQPVDSGLQRF